MKKKTMIAGVALGVAVILVTADYFAVFGVSNSEQLDLITMKFITVDEENGTPVTGVHVRCFQSNNKNACSERDDSSPGTVSISIPVLKTITKSYLFVQSATLRDTEDPKLRIMFIHADYANPVESFLVSELSDYSSKSLTITMPKSLANKY